MSSAAAAIKLSHALKSIIAAPHALGSPRASPGRSSTSLLFNKIRSEGEAGGVGRETWLTLTGAAMVTVNSPEGICELFDYAKPDGIQDQVRTAAVSERFDGDSWTKLMMSLCF